MDITIAICTKGRNDLLPGTLESIAATTGVSSSWHIILVDNNTDLSAAPIAAAFKGRLPLDYEHEPRPGSSAARNHAVKVAKGNWIIWLDDDVRIAPDLISTYVRGFERWPGATFFGGAVRPVFENPSPPWFEKVKDLILHLYGHVSMGPDGRPIADPLGPLPISSNCAVSTVAQRRFLFDLKRGPRPGRLIIRGEESDVLRRMIRAGMTGVWLPSAHADHWISLSRQTTAELRRCLMGQGWAYGQGWGGIYEGDIANKRNVRPPLASVASRALAKELRYLWLRVRYDERRWVSALLEAALASGILAGRFTAAAGVGLVQTTVREI
jgi:glycosyltransferase involved in cell wall biosynthesis